MYHSFTEINKEIYGVLSIIFMDSNKGHVILLESRGNAQIANVKSNYYSFSRQKIKFTNKKIKIDHLKEKMTSYEFQITKATDAEQAYQMVDKILSDYKEQRKGPTAIVCFFENSLKILIFFSLALSIN